MPFIVIRFSVMTDVRTALLPFLNVPYKYLIDFQICDLVHIGVTYIAGGHWQQLKWAESPKNLDSDWKQTEGKERRLSFAFYLLYHRFVKGGWQDQGMCGWLWRRERTMTEQSKAHWCPWRRWRWFEGHPTDARQWTLWASNESQNDKDFLTERNWKEHQSRWDLVIILVKLHLPRKYKLETWLIMNLTQRVKQWVSKQRRYLWHTF